MIPELGFLDLALFFVLSAFLWIGIPLGLFMLFRRSLRANERRAASPELQELRSQLEVLQGQAAELANENARLREALRLEPPPGENQTPRHLKPLDR